MNEEQLAAKIAGMVMASIGPAPKGLTDDDRAFLESIKAERAAHAERQAKVVREEEADAIMDTMRGDKSCQAYAKDVGAKTPDEIKSKVQGRRFARYCRAQVVAAKNGQTAAQQLKNWGSTGGRLADKVMADELEQRAEALSAGGDRALSISSLSGGGALVPPGWSGELIPMLRNATVVDRIPQVRHVAMTTSDLPFPRQVGAATAYYLGENVQVTASDQQFADRKLTRKKLISMTAFSNSLLKVADPSIDSLVLDDLVQVMRIRRDLAFLRGDGASDTPRGLRFWALAANIQAQTGTTAANKITDLTRPRVRLFAQNIPAEPANSAYIFSSRTWGGLFSTVDANSNPVFQAMMLGNQLYNFPFLMSNQVPENLGGGSDSEMLFVHGPSVIIGDAVDMEVTPSNEASYFDGTNLVSLYTRDMSAIRVVSEHDLIARYEEGIHVTTGVTWA